MRLTKKYKEDYFVNPDNRELTKLDIENDHNSSQIIRNKLGQLEDIEEALGVDLIIYLKMCVIETSVFLLDKIINEVYEIRCPQCVYNPYLKAFGFKAPKDTYNWRFPMSEYGKTWAFTREELE